MTINLNNLDKSDWPTFRFDQIAKSISERVDPNNTDIELYYGLEHLDSESLHLRRSGTPADVGGQKLKCYPGDVIFGKRRAYQRKAAVVNDVAICSAHAMVLRANPDVIDPKLFPFFLHSDQFMHRAIDISVGSLSPTINWKTLREQEFLLPPKEQQAEIAQLLWAADDVVEKDIALLDKTEIYYQTAIHYLTLGRVRIRSRSKMTTHPKLGDLPSDWDVCSLEKYSSLITNGFVGTATPYYSDKESGVKYIQGMNVRRNRIDLKGLTYITPEFHEKQKKTKLREGDLLTVQSGHIGETAVVPKSIEGCNCHAVIITRLSKTEFNPAFVSYFINSPKGQVKIAGITVGTTVAHVNTSELKKYVVPKPTLREQCLIVDNLDSIKDNIRSMRDKISSSKSLQKSLINQVF